MSFFSVIRQIRRVKPIERNVRREPTEAVVLETMTLLLVPETQGDIALERYVVKDLGLMPGDLEDLYSMLEKTFRCKPPLSEYQSDMKVVDVVALFEKYRSQ